MKMKYPTNYYMSLFGIASILLMVFYFALDLAYEAIQKHSNLEVMASAIFFGVASAAIFPSYVFIKNLRKLYKKLMERLGSKERAGAAIVIFNEIKALKKHYPHSFEDIVYEVVKLVDEEESP